MTTELADLDLAEYIRQMGDDMIPKDRVLDICDHIASTLDGCRNLGMVHNTVAPQHLLLHGSDIALTGFCRFSEINREVPRTVDRLAEMYEAPELDSRRSTPTTDQYSLGCVYLAMRTGVVVLGDRASKEELIGRLDKEEGGIVHKSMSKRPIDRFATCTDFIEAIRGGSARE